MRTIKFRAWDAIHTKMYLWDIPETHSLWIDFGGHIFKPSGIREFISLDDKDFILMQFTGLLDKNGKEIYEGDIIRIENYKTEWKHGEPPFDWRLFSIEWIRYTWVFTNKAINTPLSDYDTRTLEPFQIEIIGNIYENPELLREGRG